MSTYIPNTRIWKNEAKGDKRLIAFIDDAIYVGDPPEEDTDRVIKQLVSDEIPPGALTKIPVTYLRAIQLEAGKNYIEILFGKDSSEHVVVDDEERRRAIFDYLRTAIPGMQYRQEELSIFQKGKKPLMAMLVIVLFFTWSYNIASGIEEGYKYTVVGGGISYASAVLLIASLGCYRIALLSGTLFLIPLVAFINKVRHPKVVDSIVKNGY